MSTQSTRIIDDTSLSRKQLSPKSLLYIAYVVGVVLIGVAICRIDPTYFIAAIIGLVILYLTWKYHFFGLCVYMTIYFLRPGERFTALESLRLELLVGVFLLLAIVTSDAVRSSRIRFPKDKVSMALWIFVGIMAASTVFSEWMSYSFDGFVIFLKLCILYYIIASTVSSRRKFETVIWLAVLLTCFVGIEAGVNYRMGDFAHVQGVDRATGHTSYGENYNSLAMYMVTAIALLLYLAGKYRSFWVRGLCLLLACSSFVTLLITGSRSGLLCLGATAMVLIWHSSRRFITLLAIVVLSIVGWTQLPDQYKTRYSTIGSTELDGSSQGRLDAWKAGLRMFTERPLLGVGPKMFTDAYGRREGVYLASHSMYIELLATMGLLGTVAWGLFFWRFIQAIRRLRSRLRETGARDSPDDRFLVTVYAIVGGLLVAGVFGHLLFRDTWYILAALVVTIGRLTDEAATG